MLFIISLIHRYITWLATFNLYSKEYRQLVSIYRKLDIMNQIKLLSFSKNLLHKQESFYKSGKNDIY